VSKHPWPTQLGCDTAPTVLQNSLAVTMAANDEGEPVQLYVYDLSRGLAKQFAPLVGLQVDSRSGSGLLACALKSERLPRPGRLPLPLGLQTWCFVLRQRIRML